MVELSRHALVGAIGGTYISLATADIDELSIANFALLNSANFKSPMEAIERYLKTIPSIPNKVGLSIAGVVEGDRASMQNLPWSFDWNDIRAVTGAQHIAFINEFEALALALPHMTDYDLLDIGHGHPKLHATKLVVGAGTGLGAAALVWAGDRWLPMSGASRLAAFPAPLDGELDIAAAIAHDGELLAGDVFCGKGLVALYGALIKRAGADLQPLKPAQITEAALSGKNQLAREGLDLMAGWMGRFVGDLALHFGAQGGVYLAGGLPSNSVPAFQTGRFRQAFDGTNERAAYLDQVQVRVIKTGSDAGLRGAAIALANSLPVRPATSNHRHGARIA